MVREWTSLLTFTEFKKAEDALVDFNVKNYFFSYECCMFVNNFENLQKG
jgi:hypothetical protein